MKYILPLISLVASVAGHGFATQLMIDGKPIILWDPNTDPYRNPVPQRVGRPVPGNGPVLDVNSMDIQCSGNSKPAALHADVAAGSTVTVQWTLWPDSHIGPTITYMARCPDQGCQDFVPKDPVWFKISEAGAIDIPAKQWAATPLMKMPNAGLAYTVPSCLAPGFYLVRHELIAVFMAAVYPGAQFYPTCHQLKVTGSGSTKPSNLVAFPGAYKPTDPGVIWSTTQTTYTIPGPPVFTCGGGGGGPTAQTTPTTPVTPITPTTPNTTQTTPNPGAGMSGAGTSSSQGDSSKTKSNKCKAKRRVRF